VLRRSYTAVLEKNSTFTFDFATEPYETGWALEARWFVRILETSPGAELLLTPQVSPDGLFWCDEGSEPLRMTGVGLDSIPLRNFGQWLRLNAKLTGEAPRVKLLIYLALKG
jgi:hypothetical protein